MTIEDKPFKRCTEWRGDHAAVTVNTVNYIDLLARYEDTGLTPDEISALRAQQEAEKNEPFTLEELKGMYGKPVWVQPPENPEFGRWAIVDCVTIERKKLYLTDGFTCHNYETDWIAYRYPKEARNV